MADQPEWVMHVPVLSTGHISRATNQLLLDDLVAGGNEIVSMADGWLCYVGEVADFGCDFPPDLLACLLWAKERGYEWLRLDSAGEQVDELPYYDDW